MNRRDHMGPLILRGAIVAALATGLLLGERLLPYFTSQSSIIALAYVVTTLVVTIQRRTSAPPAPRLRGAVTFWLLTTALISHILNNRGESPLPGLVVADPALAIDNWGLFLLHYVAPGLVLLDWALFGPHGIVRWRDTLLWLLYPIGYGGVMIARGALLPEIIVRYPYPFLDPTLNGVDGMLLALLRVVVMLAVISLAVVALDRLSGFVSRRLTAPSIDPAAPPSTASAPSEVTDH